MSALSLTLCGRVTLWVDGKPIEGLGAKSLALMAFLALEPGAHTRDELSALLWGEYPDEKAKASLRQALTHLREAVPDALKVDRTTVSLRGAVDCDVNRFVRLATETPRLAIDFPASRFLEGLSLRRCEVFADWVDGIRASLEKRLADVIATSTREHLAKQQWREAARCANRWAVLLPLAPAAHIALIEALFMAGDRQAALNAFGEYRSRLASEAGERPEPEILRLVERIRAAEAPVRRQATEAWYENAPSFDGDLIGREREWETLTRAWRDVMAGQARITVIEGEPGVGKTRLAGDLMRSVSAAGGTVLRGRAFDVRGGPAFGGVIEPLRSMVHAPGLAGTDPQWLAEVARVVPELRTRFPNLPPSPPFANTDAWRLFEGVAQMLIALGDEAPVAILIDDAHWCDADSCALLHSLVRRLDNVPILWCLISSAGSVARDTPAARLMRALRATPHAITVTLRPLGEEEVWHLIRGLGRISTPNVARHLATRIHEATTGYPFYVIELLKTLFAQQWLIVDPGTGEWIVRTQDADASALLALAPSVHETIAERIECLPDELRAMLIAIAVSARGCRTDMLSHVHGISRLRAAALGDALVERHLAVEHEGKYQCAHPLIARVVSDALSTSRRREVHRSVALALEAAAEGRPMPDPGEVALHAEQGGERSMTYRYAMLAATECEARFAHEEALAWLDMAASASDSDTALDVVNRTTDRLLEKSGPGDMSRAAHRGSYARGLTATDVDLPARVDALGR